MHRIARNNSWQVWAEVCTVYATVPSIWNVTEWVARLSSELCEWDDPFSIISSGVGHFILFPAQVIRSVFELTDAKSSCPSHTWGGSVHTLTIICLSACLRMVRIMRLVSSLVSRPFGPSLWCLPGLGTCLHANSQACTPTTYVPTRQPATHPTTHVVTTQPATQLNTHITRWPATHPHYTRSNEMTSHTAEYTHNQMTSHTPHYTHSNQMTSHTQLNTHITRWPATPPHYTHSNHTTSHTAEYTHNQMSSHTPPLHT